MTVICKKLESEESTDSPSLKKPGFFSFLFFRWVNGVVELSKRLPLTTEDLYPLSAEDEPEVVTEKLEKAWNQELCEYSELAKATSKTIQPSLLRAIVRFLSKSECVLVVLLASMRSTCLLLICVLLYYFLGELINKSAGVSKRALICASSISVCAGVMAFAMSHFQFRATRLGMKVRTALTGLLYKKVLRVPAHHSINGIRGPGKVLNLVSNDVHRFHKAFLYFPVSLLAPFEIIAGFTMLGWYAGRATLSGLCVAVVAVSLQSWCGKLVINLRCKAAAVADKRVTETREIISGIRAVKTSAWENFIRKSFKHYDGEDDFKCYCFITDKTIKIICFQLLWRKGR